MIYRQRFQHGYYLILIHALLLVAACSPSLCRAAADTGSSQVLANAAGSLIKIYLYRPSCANPSILIVFHGLNRKAKRTRDNAINLAEDACLMVFAPLFDKTNFPNWRYHRAGIVRSNQVQHPSLWTASILRALLDFSRKYIANSEAKIYLFGHSAGGQFLSRSFAYSEFSGVERVVIANPSVHVEPTLDIDAPYGFASIFNKGQALMRLKSYLSSPITIYLGTDDIGHKYLVESHMANRQGKNRYERGRYIFLAGMKEAARQNIAFLWNLVEACGIGHSSSGMMNANEMRYALGLSKDISNNQHPCSSEQSKIDNNHIISDTHTGRPQGSHPK